MNPIYFIGWAFYKTAFTFYFGWKVFNRERVPRTGAVILAANHASFLDPGLIGSSLPRDISYFGRKSLFKVPLIAWILKYVNAVPLDRDGGGADGLKVILERLSLGCGLILFPEGTRTEDGNLQKGRSGIGFTVIKSTAPVVPVRLWGTFEAWGRKDRWPKRHQVMVKYGMPMEFKMLREESKTCGKSRLKEIYQQVADEIMAEIAKLEPIQD